MEQRDRNALPGGFHPKEFFPEWIKTFFFKCSRFLKSFCHYNINTHIHKVLILDGSSEYAPHA